ncbi:CHAT domain-containing protein [Lysobacter korlensis]|uniref:CHAT domain-containing protein n=1 Tax=Lysobacter korlensis TaxID=553636 RepID=A0ABV6S0N8_9GAMM
MTLHAITLTTLISEDLRGVPGPALENALAKMAAEPEDQQAHLDACLAALLAGEAKRALGLLSRSQQNPRVTAALTAWARLLDGNRYPGGIGGETAGTVDAAVTPAPGPPLETLLEHIAAYGPPGLATVRTLLELALRAGNLGGVQQAVATGINGLQQLGNTAAGVGFPAIGQWATLAGADLLRRAGMPDWQSWMQQARAMAAEPAQLALTFLVEGDWRAAPGSSPEAMGLDLAAMTRPSPLGIRDLAAAGELWANAAALVAAPGTAAPALTASLALRRALLSRAAGDAEARRSALDDATEGYRLAGDSAGVQLATIHRVVADIDDGRLGSLALELGGGWRPPERGPVSDVVVWAETVGSRSWCVGLSRLLERVGGAWTSAGSAHRARIAYLAALGLASVDRSFPSRTLVTAVADADSRSNLATNALLRLERGLGDLFGDPNDPDPFAFAQRLEASYVMIGALRARSRGAGAGLAADRFDKLRAQLATAIETARAELPAREVDLPQTLAELQAAIAAKGVGDSLEEQSAASEQGFQLMRQMQLGGALDQLDSIDVLGPICRASAARQAGRDDEAMLWNDAAVDAARKTGIAGYLLPLALIEAQRLEDARVALAVARASGTVPDEFALLLALRAEDQDAATAALDALVGAGTPPEGWSDLLAEAEVELRAGDHDRARSTIEAAITDLEGSVSLLLRDPERIDACDRPDVAALYSTLALALLAGGGPDAAEASINAAERLLHLTAADTVSGAAADGGRAWRLAAASYSAVANGILAVLPNATASEAEQRFALLDAVDHDLAAAELALDAANPGILLRRAAPVLPSSIAEVRARMPKEALLLDYLAVGDDLLAWAVTRDDVRPHHSRIRTRDLTSLVRAFHSGCSAGRAPDTRLAELLLTPFADLLRTRSRVVVVPFGPLTLVPFHALQLDGTPLGLTHTLSYAARAATAFAAGFDQPARRTRPLVVGDPAFDPAARPGLKPLPGSLAEARAVAQVLGAADPLVGTSATEAAVGALLGGADLVHISSHGHLEELSPFASSLVLARSDELTVADFAGMRLETDLAVLTGCDTGRGAATLGGDLVGLTRALLRSGVRRAIVSMWPVDDVVAPVLVRAFYDALVADIPPAEALATAQRSLAALSADDLRAAYEALGGDPAAARGVRRGVPALDAELDAHMDPELRDDEEVPKPLGGDAARYWAPFILVT